MNKKCVDCSRVRGHKPTCPLYGTKNTEPNVTIPDGCNQSQYAPDVLFYLPLPNTIDEGIYVTAPDLQALLLANKNKPAAIEYIADMIV